MILYGYYYNPCIHESAASLVSLHKTKEGAEANMKKIRQQNLECWQEIYAAEGEEYVEPDWVAHWVAEIEVME